MVSANTALNLVMTQDDWEVLFEDEVEEFVGYDSTALTTWINTIKKT
ncbi:hypothetical protein N9Y89_02200 [bacterium]|nr:hypothetical protein [bacterium]